MKKILKYFLILLASLFFLLGGLLVWFHFFIKQETEIDLMVIEPKRPFIIPVEIDGKTYPFVWDTGAEMSNIKPSLAHELGYYGKNYGLGKLKGVKTILTDSFYYDIIPIRLGDIDLKEYMCLLDYERMSPNRPILPYDSAKYVGYIGQNIISKYHWLFNFKENKVKIYNYEKYMEEESDDDIFKLSFTGAHPIAKLCINERDTFSFKFDTGYLVDINFSVNGEEYETAPEFIFLDSLSNFIKKEEPYRMSFMANNSMLLFDTLQINEWIMNSILTGDNTEHFNRTENYITAYFAYRFRQMYYNPKEKEISFYISPQDSAFVYRGEAEKALFNQLKSLLAPSSKQ